MKLYYFAAACSQASNIALREAGLKFELVKVDRHTKKAADGLDFNTVNPKGYVPGPHARQRRDADRERRRCCSTSPTATRPLRLAPAGGTMERYRLIEWLAFINSEIHKTFSPLFRPDAPRTRSSTCSATSPSASTTCSSALGSRPFLMGEQFTVADCYLFVVLSWAPFVKLDLGKWPELKRYVERIQARPHVIEALKSEGLIK